MQLPASLREAISAARDAGVPHAIITETVYALIERARAEKQKAQQS